MDFSREKPSKNVVNLSKPHKSPSYLSAMIYARKYPKKPSISVVDIGRPKPPIEVTIRKEPLTPVEKQVNRDAKNHKRQSTLSKKGDKLRDRKRKRAPLVYDKRPLGSTIYDR